MRTTPLPEQVLSGRYRLVRLIARGGMAQVWEAHDETLDRAVAVKVLHPHLAEDDAFLERFRREAVAAARLSHPSVVTVYDTGLDNGVAFIVMELVRGKTLRELLAARGGLTPAHAVQVAMQVAEALSYAHGHDVVHRDVKPANVLITDDGRAKVADFGIAKATSSAFSGGDLTQTGSFVGTARYLSPEQVNGEPQDRRSDIYSLGVVLYEMLCGRPPFTGESELAVAVQHAQATPVGPRQVRAGIPRSLEAVVLKAMAKAPEQRYDTASDLWAALANIDLVDDDAIRAVVRDPTPPEGITPTFAQSERSWLIPVIAILLIAIALGTVGVLFARTDEVRDLLDGSSSPSTDAPSPVALVGARAFDPLGDSEEHDGEARNVVDGDPATSWRTESYSDRTLGKAGVGILVELPDARDVRTVEIESATKGYQVSVYVADRPQDTLEAWGAAVAAKTAVDGNASFDVGGRRGSAVLVWITALGDARSVVLDEVRVLA